MPRSTIHGASYRELYIVVYGLGGMVLAHGANKDRIGTNQINDKDADGKEFGRGGWSSPRRTRGSGDLINS